MALTISRPIFRFREKEECVSGKIIPKSVGPNVPNLTNTSTLPTPHQNNASMSKQPPEKTTNHHKPHNWTGTVVLMSWNSPHHRTTAVRFGRCTRQFATSVGLPWRATPNDGKKKHKASPPPFNQVDASNTSY